jgi:hypothetical protein
MKGAKQPQGFGTYFAAEGAGKTVLRFKKYVVI